MRPPGVARTTWYVLECFRLAIRYLFVRRHLPGTIRANGDGRPGGRLRPASMIARLVDDVRYALRGLRHQAAFTATAVAVLALGIGTATAVFAAFHAVVVKDLPVADPGRLVRLSLQAQSGDAVTLSPEEIDVLARDSRTLVGAAGVAAFGAEAFPLAEDGRSLVLAMSSVTADFFEVLGARPVLGRLLRPSDDEEGAEPVAVLAYPAWQREFGGDPAVLGVRLTQSQTRRSYTVVGVAPPGLALPAGVGYWISSGPPGRRALGGASMEVIGRLAPGAPEEVARAELLSIARALDGRRSRPRAPEVASIRPLTDAVLGPVRPMLLAITLAVGLLLSIACVNVGNLLLIRTAQRSREVMVRRALGASSGGIVRLLVVESTLLGGAGGLLGLGLAAWLMRVLTRIAPDRLPRSEMIELAGTPVGMALGVTLAAVLLFGVVPPLVATRGNLASELRVDGRAGTGTERAAAGPARARGGAGCARGRPPVRRWAGRAEPPAAPGPRSRLRRG